MNAAATITDRMVAVSAAFRAGEITKTTADREIAELAQALLAVK